MIRLHGLLRLSSLFVAMAAASAAHALGVGEVSLNSRLNQPLDAKIALFEAAGLDSNEVIVKLASPEAFERVGLDRPYFLTDLKFKPTLQGAQGNILVTSSKPVREPYLSFLIEVIWPNGRMLREYTLLLDPPIYTAAQQNVASKPAQTAPAQTTPTQATTAASTPTAQTQPTRATPPASPPVQPTQPARAATSEQTPPSASGVLPSGQYQVQSNDTLWKIASDFGASGSGLHQTMLAIQDNNPDAFINNNINLLKKGQILRLPDEQQINSRTAAVAVREVARQNDAWRESRAQTVQRQIDASGRGTGTVSSGQESRDNLRLISATSEGSSALNERLAAAQESLDSSRRENEELKSRLGDLEEQVEKLQRLVELKDASLANLQAQLASHDTNTAASNAVVFPSHDEVDSTPLTPAENLSQQTMPDVSTTASSNETTTTDDNSEQVPQPVTTATVVDTPVVEVKWWESWLNNPTLLWGAGGAALLLVLLLLMGQSRRNARKWAERELEAELASEENQKETDFTAGLDLPDPTLNDLISEEPLASKKEAPLNAQQDEEASLDSFLMTDKPVQAADKNSNLVLDDFADFDLKFDPEPKSDKPSLPLDLSEDPLLEPVYDFKDDPLPSLDRADEFDFITNDDSQSFKEPAIDDFDLEDKTPLIEATAEPLGDLDFADVDDISAPPTQTAEPQPQPPKPSLAEEFKAADDDFDFLSGTDETETKLDLARAYIDMGDMEGARDILDEVMSEGSDSQRSEASELMTSLA